MRNFAECGIWCWHPRVQEASRRVSCQDAQEGGPHDHEAARAAASADHRAHSRRHLLVVDHGRAPAGGRRAACRGSATG
eukprot:4703817-Prymnesium_polylepis.1